LNYEEASAYILQIPKFTEKNSLEHTREFLRRLGSPEKGRKVIHVAGTNGKGSVCAYMQALLLSERKKVGFFTSPHLICMNERIRVDGEMITDEDFLDIFTEVLEVTETMKMDGLAHPTFFEFLFGMAMRYFARAGAEYVILETGLGGRLDATNAVDRPFLTVITSISLDHMEILGNTIEQIAGEKAGIIKEGVPLICDANCEESLQVLRKVCRERKAPCREISKNAYEIKKITGKDIAFSSTDAYYESVMWVVKSCAVYQVMNAALALAAMKEIYKTGGRHLDRWQKAIASVTWEGRMEEVRPGIIVDGAHNMGAVEAFVESVKAQEESKKTVILFSAVKEKSYEDMIAYLCSNIKADTYVVTTIDNDRGVKAEELLAVFHKYTKSRVLSENNAEAALRKAVQIKGKDGKLYCLGSLYLVGMIKELL